VTRSDSIIDRLADRRIAAGLVLLGLVAVVLAWFGLPTPAPLVVLWMCVAPFVVVGLTIPPPDRRYVAIIVLAGMSLRLVIAAAAALFLSTAVYGLFDDTVRYEEIGQAMAQAWRSHQNIDLFAQYQLTVAGYYYVVAALTFLSTGGPFLIGVFNASLACLTAPVLYWIADAVRARGAERLVAVAIGSFIPSVVLWSAIPLKDTAISLVFCLGILCTFRLVALTDVRRMAWLATLSVCMLIVSTIRIYATLFLSVFVVLVLVLTHTWRSRPRWSAAALVVVAAVQLWSLQGPEGNLVTSALTDITTLERIQGQLNGGGSGEATPTPTIAAVASGSPATPRATVAAASAGPAPISTLPPGSSAVGRYLSLAVRFPVQFAQFYVLPIPFVTRGNSVALAFPEMLLWYVMLPLAVVGLVALWRRDRGSAAAIAFISLVMASVYGVIVGNAGSILRYRAQEMLLLAAPISVGVHTVWRWWQTRRASVPRSPDADGVASR
jgi:hypothetical protein